MYSVSWWLHSTLKPNKLVNKLIRVGQQFCCQHTDDVFRSLIVRTHRTLFGLSANALNITARQCEFLREKLYFGILEIVVVDMIPVHSPMHTAPLFGSLSVRILRTTLTLVVCGPSEPHAYICTMTGFDLESLWLHITGCLCFRVYYLFSPALQNLPINCGLGEGLSFGCLVLNRWSQPVFLHELHRAFGTLLGRQRFSLLWHLWSDGFLLWLCVCCLMGRPGSCSNEE